MMYKINIKRKHVHVQVKILPYSASVLFGTNTIARIFSVHDFRMLTRTIQLESDLLYIWFMYGAVRRPPLYLNGTVKSNKQNQNTYSSLSEGKRCANAL